MSRENRSRLLGVDYGTVRVGLAISDESGEFVFPFDVLTVGGIKEAVRRVAEICGEKDIAEIVVGLPLNMDGSHSAMTDAAADFAARLEKRLSLPVHLWDERLTSAGAEKALLAADVSRSRRKQLIDQMAAQAILESFLARRREDGMAPGSGAGEGPEGYGPEG